jgi:hypothetical protein
VRELDPSELVFIRFEEAISVMLSGQTTECMVNRRSGAIAVACRIHRGKLERQVQWNGKWIPYSISYNEALDRTWFRYRNPTNASETDGSK